MKINKETQTGQTEMVCQEDLDAINTFTKRSLTADDVFTFSVLLCDNEVDRDFERFTVDTLYDLEKLFLGKTGIFDHHWSATEQVARIYRTEVVVDNSRKTVCGEDYTYLKGYAYMLRVEENKGLIADIEGGIKREVSVGCAVRLAKCSICGEEIGSMKCGHVRGRTYDGRLCFAELCAPSDAYEWSFVAVPAQINAGVMKRFGTHSRPDSLEVLVKMAGDHELDNEFRELVTHAELGRRYLNKLRDEVVRMGVMLNCGYQKAFLEKTTGKMDEEELLQFKKVFEKKLDEVFPPVTQLGGYKPAKNVPEAEFMI
jgi:hypothetical protein